MEEKDRTQPKVNKGDLKKKIEEINFSSCESTKSLEGEKSVKKKGKKGKGKMIHHETAGGSGREDKSCNDREKCLEKKNLLE
jgi:hypothetical protein